MAKGENSNDFSAEAASDHASFVSLSANESRTCEKIDTQLTQPRSPRVLGWVYFARAGDEIKIGHSRQVDIRLSQLQYGLEHELVLLATIRGGLGREQQYHAKFHRWRLHGEWFSPCDEILAEIDLINNPPKKVRKPKKFRLSETERMKREIYVAMLRHQVPEKFVIRQMRMVNRVRVQAVTQAP
jgi:hypothetical protein